MVLASIDHPSRTLALWDGQEKQGRRLVGIAGANAHGRELGGRANWDNYLNAFSIAGNRVWVRQLDRAGLEEAVRAGRLYVAFDALGDPAGFEFEFWRREQGWRSYQPPQLRWSRSVLVSWTRSWRRAKQAPASSSHRQDFTFTYAPSSP